MCVVEEQDIVYRSGRAPGSRYADTHTDRAPDPTSPWHLRLQPDPTLLFRFSPLTANTHRIHYDTPYCQHTEGCPGLVVHGPLLALLTLELARRGRAGCPPVSVPVSGAVPGRAWPVLSSVCHPWLWKARKTATHRSWAGSCRGSGWVFTA